MPGEKSVKKQSQGTTREAIAGHSPVIRESVVFSCRSDPGQTTALAGHNRWGQTSQRVSRMERGQVYRETWRPTSRPGSVGRRETNSLNSPPIGCAREGGPCAVLLCCLSHARTGERLKLPGGLDEEGALQLHYSSFLPQTSFPGSMISRTHKELSADHIAHIAATYHAWRSGADACADVEL